MAMRTWAYGCRWGLCVGCAATLVGCVALSLGWLGRIDRYGQDQHFRYLSTIEADPRIVMIDIDDRALADIGPWPWPRRLYGALIRTLDELGAGVIAMDIAFLDRKPPRTDDIRFGKYYDVDPVAVAVGDGSDGGVSDVGASDAAAVFDDDELAAAMALAGCVYVPMLVDFAAGDEGGTVAAGAGDRGAGGSDRDTVMDRVDRAPGGAGSERDRMVAALMDDFVLGAEDFGPQAADPALRVASESVRRWLPGAKRTAARRLAARYVADNPGASFGGFFDSVVPDAPLGHMSPDRTTLCEAFCGARAARAVFGKTTAVPAVVGDHIARGYAPTLPIDKIAAAAKGVGFATYDRRRYAGVLRALPPVVDVEGQLVWQLGALVAADVIGVAPSSLGWDHGVLTVSSDAGARRIPLGEHGDVVVNWHAGGGAGRWLDSFDHVPAARVMEIALNRDAIEANARRLGASVGALVFERFRDAPPSYGSYAALVRRRNALRRERRTATTRARLVEIDAATARLEATTSAVERDAIEWLQYQWRVWENAAPVDDGERAERDRIRGLYAVHGEGQLAARLEGYNAGLRRRNQVLLDELRPRIEHRICFVGDTATAVADLVTTPIDDSVPGVMAHANMANMMLGNRFVTLAPRWMNIALMAVAGLAITVLTCMRGPIFGLCCLAGVEALVVATGGVAFYTATVQTASLPAAVWVGGVWAAVTLYRQFTEERAKRRLRRALAQYTSPAVASRIAARARPVDLSPRPATVTCFFSDLTGFTGLSERLGAARTRALLNPYLERVSDALVAHDAMVNKFIGDGVFAFFNAPIWSCPEHARAACQSAVAVRDAVAGLYAPDADAARDGGLIVRIGVSTGEAFVGDYGSSTKLDYTCIGDTVNVGSRLESANKAFGTCILVDEATRARAGDTFVFRPLGWVRIHGKARAVAVHELVETCDRADAATRRYADEFAAAVAHFQAGAWDRCAEALAACRERRPEDGAVDVYVDAVAQCRANPPPQHWDRAIALTGERPAPPDAG